MNVIVTARRAPPSSCSISGVWRWPVDLVRRDVLVGRDEVRRARRRAAGAGDAGLGVDHDVADQPRARQRREPEQRRGRVAAGVGDEVGARDLRRGAAPAARRRPGRTARAPCARRTSPRRCRGRAAGSRPTGRRPARRARAARRRPAPPRRAGRRRPPRRRRVPVGVEDLELQRHARARVHVVEPLAGLRARGHVRELEERVAVEQLRGDRAGVAGGAEDGDL